MRVKFRLPRKTYVELIFALCAEDFNSPRWAYKITPIDKINLEYLQLHAFKMHMAYRSFSIKYHSKVIQHVITMDLNHWVTLDKMYSEFITGENWQENTLRQMRLQIDPQIEQKMAMLNLTKHNLS